MRNVHIYKSVNAPEKDNDFAAEGLADSMISAEPKIKVGICEGYEVLPIRLNGPFSLSGRAISGLIEIRIGNGKVRVLDERRREIHADHQVSFLAGPGATFTILDVRIGINFHWERKQEETFSGNLKLMAVDGGAITAINELGLEDYLVSVISSEMNPAAPEEFLKSQAIVSRSWLAAMLERKGKKSLPAGQTAPPGGEIIRWYGREEHELFDVCADDHCQRYQGLPAADGGRAGEAVQATRGLFLLWNNEICDARYHKACGGRTDNFATAWEDQEIPYLSSLSDSAIEHPSVRTEKEARDWILANPTAYCNTLDGETLKQILPSFDRETQGFFRWQVEYSRRELEEIVREKASLDLGALYDFIPLGRGPSGRIFRLQIRGTKASVIVGKELEIRRLLSPSHLLSSAFIVIREDDRAGKPLRFILKGAGWGHGVGLCQIGAAVIAKKGLAAPEILSHYFHGASLTKLY